MAEETATRDDRLQWWFVTARRIRDAFRRMRDPGDLVDLLSAVHRSLSDLGLPLARCAVHVVDVTVDPPVVESHSVGPGSDDWRSETADAEDAETVVRIWRGGVTAYRHDLSTTDPRGEGFRLTPLRSVVDVPLATGTLRLGSDRADAFSPEDLAIVAEVAGLLDEGFQRIAEVRRLRARHRVEEEVWRMRRKEDILQVLVALRAGLSELGLGGAGCGINVLETRQGRVQVRSHNMLASSHWQEPPSDEPLPLLERFWRGGVSAYRPDLLREDRYGERAWIHGTFQTRIRCIVDVPFSHGTLALNSTEPDAFTPGQIRMLEELAEVLSEGFRRTDDLEALEQRNRELEQQVEERRRAEERLAASVEEKVVLLKEVHHRVKNNLQIVSSLLNMQSERVGDPSVTASFEESRWRIQSMALIHERLYESQDLSHIDCGEYLRLLSDNVVRSYEMAGAVELSVHACRLEVDVDTAAYCGLVVNELLSNCLKHAFPAGRGGSIRLDLVRTAPEEATLRVADDGVGLPPGVEIGADETLGLQLVADLAEQLHGSLRCFEDGGTTFELTFPVSSKQTTAQEI